MPPLLPVPGALAPAALADLCARFAVAPTTVADIGQRGGFGGCYIVRLDTAAGVRCLRGWPASLAVARVHFLQQAVAHAAAHDYPLLPRPLATVSGDHIVTAHGRHWELTTWAAGSADYERQPRAERLAAAARAVAALHHAWDGFPVADDHLSYDPAALAATIDAGVREIFPRLSIDRAGAAPAAMLFQALGGAVVRVRAALDRDPAPLTDRARLAHGDIDPEHLFFDGDTVTGLIDFDQTGFRPPALDLAMLLDRFAGWEPAAVRTVLDAYQSVRPLAPADVAALPALALVAIAGWAWEAVEARYLLGADFSVYREDFPARATRYARRLAAIPAELPR